MRFGPLITFGAIVASLGVALGGQTREADGRLSLIGGSDIGRSKPMVFAGAGGAGWLSARSGGLVVRIAARADDTLSLPDALSGRQRLKPRRAVAAPVITRVEVAGDGSVRFEGIGSPGSRVTLKRYAASVGAAEVAADGGWQMRVSASLAAGEHRFETVATAQQSQVAAAGDEVRIAIPSDFAVQGAVAFERSPDQVAERRAQIDADTRRRAEDLERAASERFDEIQRERAPRVSQVPADATKGAPAAAPDPEPGLAWDAQGAMLRVQEWLEKANRDFQREIVRRLQVPGPTAPAEELAGREPASKRDAAEADRKAAEARDAAAERARAEAERKAEADRKAAEARDAAAERARAEAERKAEAVRKAAVARDAAAERARAEAERKAV
ncbi:MAG: hypothetical protein AB7E80_13345, partial [Hyphomicrobiaceae bacterium]